MARRQADQEPSRCSSRRAVASSWRSSIPVAIAAVLLLCLLVFGWLPKAERSEPETSRALPDAATPPPEVPATPGRIRPYLPSSPWNRPIGPNPVYDPESARRIARLSGLFSADPTQHTYPIYEVRSGQPLRVVTFRGVFSDAKNGGQNVVNRERGTVRVPIPDGAQPAAGSDAHIVVWDVESGDEWGFWQLEIKPDGTYSAQNGYHYNTGWSAVPPAGLFASRGSGIPNLAGVIRPWEIGQAHIDHALAFAYPSPTAQFVYPAVNSDGESKHPDLPEGARLQLDPELTEADFDRWGLDRAGKIIARAMQKYGLIVTDRSGTPQLFVEYEGTAHWNGVVNADTVANIPYSALRVLAARSGGSLR